MFRIFHAVIPVTLRHFKMAQLTAKLLKNDFYSTSRLNGCLGYLLDNDCYDSLAVLLT